MTSDEMIKKTMGPILARINDYENLIEDYANLYDREAFSEMIVSSTLFKKYESVLNLFRQYEERNPHDLIERVIGCPLTYDSLEYDDPYIVAHLTAHWPSNGRKHYPKSVILKVYAYRCNIDYNSRYQVEYIEPQAEVTFSGLPRKGTPFFSFNK